MNPPRKSAINEITVVMMAKEDSCVEVNLKTNEKTKLATMSKTKIAIIPKRMEVP